jgi:hypothetical protein
MNAAASSLIEAIKYTYYPGSNAKWNKIPDGLTSWYKYGGGGVNSWGSVCGVPNGCIAVLNLMNTHTLFADQIMFYACQTEFPVKGAEGVRKLWEDDVGSGWTHEPLPDGDVPAYTIAGSPLCHVSVSKWAYKAGISMTAATSGGIGYKLDRCAKVAASIAAFTADLLNEYILTHPIPEDYTMPEATATCITCHSGSTVPAQAGKMDCETCHYDGRPHLPAADPDHPGWTPTAIAPTVAHDNLHYVSDFNVSFTDNSTDNTYPIKRPDTSLIITVNWGDGHVSVGSGHSAFSHTYVLAGKYKIIQTAKDAGNLYASDMFDVSVPEEASLEKYSITVNVKDSDDDGIDKATLYLKRLDGTDWIQIMYGYTGNDGSKTFSNLMAGEEYKVVVYKSGLDFDGDEKGTQNKVEIPEFTLNTDKMFTVTQGDEADNGPTGRKWTGDNGTHHTIT